MKKIVSLFICFAVCLSLMTPAIAESTSENVQAHTLAHDGWAQYVITNDRILWTLDDYFLYKTDTRKTLENVVSVTANESKVIAVKADGELYEWSNAAFDESDPTMIMEDVVVASTSGYHTMVIKTDGTLWAWGENKHGELGTNQKDSLFSDYSDCGVNSDTPIKIMDNVSAVSAASSSRYGSYTLAVKTDGSLWAWGGNECGQLGNGGSGNWKFRWSSGDEDGITCQSIPVKIMDDVVSAFACESASSYAIKKDGSLWAWGSNASGQLGDGTFEDRSTPVKIMDNVASISADDTSSSKAYGMCLAVKKDGTLWGWGIWWGGEFGNDGTGYNMKNSEGEGCQTIPVQLADHVSAASAAHHSSLIIKTDGTLWKLNGKQIMENVLIPANSSLLDSQLSGTATENRFSDVFPNTYYVDSVKWAVDQGITSGTSATTFSPEQTCTRAQILTFLWRAAGSPEPKGNASFSDVDSSAYYAKAAAWAAEQGMVAGNAFAADTPCTRLEAVEYMWKYSASPDAASTGFTDVNSPAVNWAVAAGVTNGTGATTFSPEQTCTRAQIVTFLHRAFA